MKKIWIIFLLAMFGTSVFGQVNLIPNFSFELNDSCPDAGDQIERCTGWHKFSDIITTPDYFNSCAPAGYLNVPNSFIGYQQDHRNCSAFAGLVTFGPTPVNYREHIGMELTQPLVIGQKYFLSFYAVMAELIYPNHYHFGMPSNNIGMRLSTVAYSASNPCPIDNLAHLYSAGVIDDSINWNRITGSIIADSAYNYIIIGNFFDDAHTDTVHYNCDSCMNSSSYYYVDDLCLSTDSMLCNGGIDNIPCNVGINENVPDNEVIIYPNPTSDFVKVIFQENQDVEIILIDFWGNTILRNVFTYKKDCTMNLSYVSSGCYLLRMVNKRNGKSLLKKIIKI